MSIKFELVAEYEDVYQKCVGGEFVSDFSESVVAHFSSEEKAKQYIAAARLKKPVVVSFGSNKVFRKSSLLNGAIAAYIRELEIEPEPVLDPEI